MMPRGRSKKEYKVSGSRNVHSGRSWSRLEETKIWMQLRSHAERLYRNEGQQMGRFQRRMEGKREVI